LQPGAAPDPLLEEEEETLRALEKSIARTRRKVNAMDRVLISRIIETLRYIEERLEEQERAGVTASADRPRNAVEESRFFGRGMR
jgi:hypothetical protein